MLYTSFPQTKNLLHMGNFGRTSCKSIRESLHFQEKMGPEQVVFSVLLFKHVQTHVHTLRFRVPIRSNKTPLGDTPSSSNKKHETNQLANHQLDSKKNRKYSDFSKRILYLSWEEEPVKTVKAK